MVIKPSFQHLKHKGNMKLKKELMKLGFNEWINDEGMAPKSWDWDRHSCLEMELKNGGCITIESENETSEVAEDSIMITIKNGDGFELIYKH